jgi:adhesin transport system outer membrane protein
MCFNSRKILWIFILCIGLLFYSASYAITQTLDFVVKHTLQQNPNALESQAKLRAAEEALNITRGEYFLKVNARAAAGAGVYDSPYYEEHDAKVDETEANLYIVQPIFSGLSTYNSMKVRHAEIKNATYNDAYTKEQLALIATQVYLDVLRSYRIKVLALDNVNVHKWAYHQVKLRYHGGGGNKTDVDLARGRLARSLSTYHNTEAFHENSRVAFVKVVGLQSQNLKLPILPLVPKNLNNALSIALQQNPALLATQQQVDAATAQVAVTKAKFLPTIDIEASANYNENVNGYPGRDNDLRALAVARYNFLNGGSDRANVARTNELRIAAIQNYQEIKRQIIQNVSEAWNDLIADRKKLRELRAHVYASRDVLAGYVKQFTMGKRSLLDVLDMRRELFNSNVAYVNGEYAVKLDSYALLANMGVLARKFS